jgi:hypothetical protein
MATSSDTAESILGRFTYQTLPRIVGVPTYASIQLLVDDLKANAASIPSELGGGDLGHLALTVPPQVYATLSNTPWVAPINPGPTPPALLPNATAAQINANRYRHLENIKIFRTYNNVQSALKQQILAAVEDIYVRTLRNTHTGYTMVTTLQLLTHLYTTYGQLTPMAMQENDRQFRSAYNPAEPFEMLVQQIEMAQSFAAAGNQAYTAQQIVSNAYSLIHNTGMFIDACREWRRRPEAEKTWSHFKTQFALAHTELGEMTHTAQAGGFHNANNAIANFANDTGEALANLATATAADRDMLRSLQATNAALIQQNTVKDAEIAQLRNQVQQFQAGLSNRGNNNNNSNNNRRNNNSGRNNNNNNNNNPNYNANNNQNNANNQNNNNQTPGTGRKRFNNSNYCWTHGYDIDGRHDSSNCRNPNEGHQHGATRNNPMGGSEANKQRASN